MKRRILSLFLTITMILTMMSAISIPVFADNAVITDPLDFNDGDDKITYSTTTNGIHWDDTNKILTLDGATVNVNSSSHESLLYGIIVPADTTIVVKSDSSITVANDETATRDAIGIRSYGNLIIQGESGSLDASDTPARLDINVSNAAAIGSVISGSAVVSLKDGIWSKGSVTIGADGTKDVDINITSEERAVSVWENSGLTLHSGSLTVNEAGYGIFVKGGIHLDGGTFKSESSSFGAVAGASFTIASGAAVTVKSDNTGLKAYDFTINGGNINVSVNKNDEGTRAIEATDGEIVINDGNIKTTGGCEGIIAVKTSLYVNAGNIDSSARTTALWANTGIEISGGTVNAVAKNVTVEVDAVNGPNTKQNTAKALYCYSGDIVIKGNAILTATGCNEDGKDWDCYGIRAKAGNITISGDKAVVTAAGNTSAFSLSDTASLSAFQFTIAANTEADGSGESFTVRKNADSKVTQGALTAAKYVKLTHNTLPSWIEIGSMKISIGSDNADDYWTNEDASSTSAIYAGTGTETEWNYHYDEDSNILYLSGAAVSNALDKPYTIGANGDLNIVLKPGTENTMTSERDQGVIWLDYGQNRKYDLSIASENAGISQNASLNITSCENGFTAKYVKLDHVNITSVTTCNGIMCQGMEIKGGILDFESFGANYATLYSKSGDVKVCDNCRLNIHSEAASATAVMVKDGCFTCEGNSEVIVEEFWGINTYGMDADADLTIKDSTVSVSGSAYAIYAETINSSCTSNITLDNSTVNLTGCRIGIETWGGRGNADINILSGTINITGCVAGIESCSKEGEAEINISGGNINVTSTDWPVYSQSNGASADTNISGGIINITGCSEGIYTYGKYGPADLNISGGKISVVSSEGAVECYASASPEAISYMNLSGGEINVTMLSSAQATSFWAIGADAEPRLTNGMTVTKGGKIVTYTYEDEETSPTAFYTVGTEAEQRSSEVTILIPQPVYDDYEEPTYTVPVSGDKETVNVSATVSGNTATVKNITSKEIEKAGTEDEVVMDLSGLSKSVTGVTIPKATFENVAESDAQGLEIRMPNGTSVVFDKDALSSVAEQSKGTTVKLVIEKDAKAEKSMNDAQKNTVSEMNEPVVLDAYFTSNGQRISDFNGGKADITADYPTDYPVRVWYVADDGAKTAVPCTYDGKTARFTVTHFSHYVIEKAETCAFTDVEVSDYFYDAVIWAVNSGVTDGIDETHFAPIDITTRAQMVTFLWKLAGSPEPAASECVFTDVNADAYYYKAVLWAIENEITDGTSETTFSPRTNVSRAQAVTFLWRYNGAVRFANMTSEGPAPSPFSDVSTSSYYYNAVLWAKTQNITDGTSETMFSPDNECTRAEVVSFLYRSVLK